MQIIDMRVRQNLRSYLTQCTLYLWAWRHLKTWSKSQILKTYLSFKYFKIQLKDHWIKCQTCNVKNLSLQDLTYYMVSFLWTFAHAGPSTMLPKLWHMPLWYSVSREYMTPWVGSLAPGKKQTKNNIVLISPQAT